MEIKFRAWDKIGKKFYFWGFNVDGATFVGPPSDGTNGFIHEQFTGIYDQNGTELYEGDIVRFVDSYMMIVKWINETAGFCGRSEWNGDTFKIIGNIHESEK